MQRIALVGSPGSGKSALAHAIADELIKSDGQCAECNTPISIIDDYPRTVRDQGSYEIGLDGGYMSSVSIAVERYNRERSAQYSHNKTIITCGTIIETSVYLAQHFERQLRMKTSEDEKLEEFQRIEGSMKMLAVLYMDTFKYDKAFYVPPVKPNDDERWAEYDRNLQAAFSAYNAPVVPILIQEYENQEDYVRQQVETVLDLAVKT